MTDSGERERRLIRIEDEIRALHHYGNPPDKRLQERVDADVESILDDVRALVAGARDTPDVRCNFHRDVPLPVQVGDPMFVGRCISCEGVLLRAARAGDDAPTPFGPDAVATTGGNAKPLSAIADMATDLGDPSLSTTFRHPAAPGAAALREAPEVKP